MAQSAVDKGKGRVHLAASGLVIAAWFCVHGNSQNGDLSC